MRYQSGFHGKKCMEIARTLAKTVHMNPEQLSFLMPLGDGLDPDNRWVRMAQLVPWHLVEEEYGRRFRRDRVGRRPLTARVALGALIVKERLGLTDRETVEQICENPYIQYFLGFGSFSSVPPFDASLMVHFRKRLGAEFVMTMNQQIVNAVVQQQQASSGETDDEDDEGEGADHGSSSDDSSVAADHDQDSAVGGVMIIDATCTPADITYPTDLKVVNQAREATERIIDDLHRPHVGTLPRPRTYRCRARQAFVSAIKSKKVTRSARRRSVGRQLRFLRRNLGIIDRAVASGRWDLRLLHRDWYKKLLVAAEVLRQQMYLYRSNARSIPNRIVSVSQPHVRPIVRGKSGVPVEFGAKISASCCDGYALLDRISWEAYHEGQDLPVQAEAYRNRTGRYPAVIHADKAYTTRANRDWCKQRGIRLGGLAPGRPPTDPAALRSRRRQARNDEGARQPIEGVFGRGKRRWSLQRIMAKLADTSATVIALVFLVMNLEYIFVLVCCLALLWMITRPAGSASWRCSVDMQPGFLRLLDSGHWGSVMRGLCSASPISLRTASFRLQPD